MRTGCGSRRLWLGMAAFRVLAAFAMVGGLGLATLRGTAAQVEGDTFVAQSYDWSLTFDDSVWEVTGEANEDGYDGLALSSPDAGFAFFEGYLGFEGDPAECLAEAEAEIEDRDGVDDLAEADDLDAPRAPRGAESALYAYVLETDDGDLLDIVEYVECRTLVEGEAVFEIAFQSLLPAWEDALPFFEELLDGLEIAEDGTATTRDEDDDTGAADEDDEDTRAADEDDEAGDRDIVLGDEDDEDDGGEPPADSGIGDGEYESPTYGYTLEWDDRDWEADPDAELVDYTDDFYEGLDRLVLRGDVGSLYVEAKVAYDGDPEDCLEEEAALLEDETGVEEFELVEDEDGDLITGENRDGGFYGVYEVVFVNDEGDEFELIDYVECRELVEGEAVLVITYVTGLPDEFNDNFEDFVEPVIETIELADGGRGTTRDDDDDEPTEEPEPTEAPRRRTPTPEPVTDGGVDGNTYESPSYGYSIEWDDTVWEVDDESSRRGVDTLVLTADFGVATFIASDEFDGDEVDCYDDLELLATDDFPDLAIIEPEGQDPLRGSDETGEFGFYTADGGSVFVFLQCSPIAGGDATLAIYFSGPAASAADAITELLVLLEEITRS